MKTAKIFQQIFNRMNFMFMILLKFIIMIIVIHTIGKNDSVNYIEVKLFSAINEANKFCIENTDTQKEDVYWQYCSIIQENELYKLSKYNNIKF